MYTSNVLIQGFPGKAICHGGLGWGTVTLLRSKDRTILVDVGSFGMRRPIERALKAAGVAPAQVTDVVLTHAHYDHSVNFTLFPNATAWIGADEMAWATAQPPGFNPLPELYVKALAESPRTRLVKDGEEFLPGLTAYLTPGHTPDRTILVDVGSFGMRRPIERALKAAGVASAQVTDVVLTHAHYDHSVNFTLFPNATAWIGADEMAWATAQPPGFNPLPELYVKALAESPRTRLVKDGEEFLPGLTAYLTPGHTPGSLVFLLTATDPWILFTGDAAKNRAELLSMAADMTDDKDVSRRSFERIWSLWRKRAGTLLVPGHDLTMRLDADGRPEHLGQRAASIAAWFGETLEETTEIDLCEARPSPLKAAISGERVHVS